MLGEMPFQILGPGERCLTNITGECGSMSSFVVTVVVSEGWKSMYSVTGWWSSWTYCRFLRPAKVFPQVAHPWSVLLVSITSSSPENELVFAEESVPCPLVTLKAHTVVRY